MKSSFRRCIREYVRDARLTKYSQIAEPSGRCTRSMLWTAFTRVAEAKVDTLKDDPDADAAGTLLRLAKAKSSTTCPPWEARLALSRTRPQTRPRARWRDQP